MATQCLSTEIYLKLIRCGCLSVDFMKKYQKTYASADFAYRLQVFQENVVRAEEMNRNDPYAEWGVTKFMDLTPAEFKDMYLIANFTSPKKEGKPYPTLPRATVNASTLPDQFDWGSQGVVTDVYDQGNCGSCWAFSTAENVETMWARAGNGLENLSMQQLVDCAGGYGNHGCGGGNPPWAFQYILQQAGGLESLYNYPYAGENQNCAFDSSYIAATIGSWGYITTGDNEAWVQTWISTYGAPSVCVDASQWQYYTGGVVTPASNCGSSIDHCVQITGWDIVSGFPIWNVRNEWGTNWGYNGYMYIERGLNICAIGDEVSSCLI